MTDRTFLSPKRLPLVLLLAAGCLGAPLPMAFAAQPAAAVTQGAETWTINMKDADIRDFIDQVAEISGETFVVDPRVKGQVTVISKHPLGLEEVGEGVENERQAAFLLLNGCQRLQGFYYAKPQPAEVCDQARGFARGA